MSKDQLDDAILNYRPKWSLESESEPQEEIKCTPLILDKVIALNKEFETTFGCDSDFRSINPTAVPDAETRNFIQTPKKKKFVTKFIWPKETAKCYPEYPLTNDVPDDLKRELKR